jgi:hypothetical protein
MGKADSVTNQRNKGQKRQINANQKRKENTNPNPRG